MFDSMDKGFDRTMQKIERRIMVAWWLGLLAVVIGLLMTGGLVYVVWHFIQKFW